MTCAVAVVGSANLDVVVSASRRPQPGETVLGDGYDEHCGGKGANQAVAAARIAGTALVAAVGDDAASGRLLDEAGNRNVDTTHVRRRSGPSGRAFITVTPDGENSIVVLPLANATLTGAEVTDSLRELDPLAVLAQLETPLAATLACASWSESMGRRFVLNPSPMADLPVDVVAMADPMVVNEGEARDLAARTGLTVAESASPADLALALRWRCRSVVVTAGSRGAWCSDADGVTHVEAERVTVADSTGAGDTFAGVLTAHLALGEALPEAVRLATATAAVVVATPRSER